MHTFCKRLIHWSHLIRWNKPSGRIILLIPAGWTLWLTPNAPPSIELVALIAVGGVCISAAGCIANDLWDRNIDQQVSRTNQRPLAKGTIRFSTAWGFLLFFLLLSLLVVLTLPITSREITLTLSLLALPLILIYPTAKRWFKYPQAFLAFCWGFSVLIPWAASQSNLLGGWPLFLTWAATLFWTFGFDTVYAMADSQDDLKLGLNSSVISLGGKSITTVSISYGFTCFLLAAAAISVGIGWIFWPIWCLATIGMQREVILVKRSKCLINIFGIHFKRQVWLGSLLLLGLVLGHIS